MKKLIPVVLGSILFLLAANFAGAQNQNLTVFCGAALKKPMEEIADVYEKQTGHRVNVTYAGVGTLFSQILLSKQGDIFVVPSPDIMERAKVKGVIVNNSIRNIAYLVPCINTQKNNPKNIRSLKDLGRPGVRIGLANPEIVYIGGIADEIINKNFSLNEKTTVVGNVVTYVEDFNKLATLLILKQVDAIIGFHFLEAWYPDKISTVKLKPNEVLRIGSAQAAVITYSLQKKKAEDFVKYLDSEKVKTIFRKYHYFASTPEAFSWVGGTKPVGGYFSSPK